MKREVKIGIFGVTMIIAAWAGIRFLKGFDIFSRNSVYYAAYDQINGVQAASPIMMKGVKIGTVTGISFDPQRSDNVVLQFTIKRQYHIPTDSEAKIYSNGLMGGKAIEINYGTARTYLQKGDTLRSVRERDLMDVAGSELDFFKQKVSQVTGDLSRTLTNLNRLMEANAQNISGTLSHLNAITGDMAGLLDAAQPESRRRRPYGVLRDAGQEHPACGQHRRQPEPDNRGAGRRRVRPQAYGRCGRGERSAGKGRGGRGDRRQTDERSCALRFADRGQR